MFLLWAFQEYILIEQPHTWLCILYECLNRSLLYPTPHPIPGRASCEEQMLMKENRVLSCWTGTSRPLGCFFLPHSFPQPNLFTLLIFTLSYHGRGVASTTGEGAALLKSDQTGELSPDYQYSWQTTCHPASLTPGRTGPLIEKIWPSLEAAGGSFTRNGLKVTFLDRLYEIDNNYSHLLLLCVTKYH